MNDKQAKDRLRNIVERVNSRRAELQAVLSAVEVRPVEDINLPAYQERIANTKEMIQDLRILHVVLTTDSDEDAKSLLQLIF